MLEHLVEVQNSHDAQRMARCFAADYRSAQPIHPGRAFTGRAQILANWTAMFDGVSDFHAELVACALDGDTEWGEVDWRGRHGDGSRFAMRGVVILVVRDEQIVEGRLYMEPVDEGAEDIDVAVEQLFKPPSAATN